MFTPAPLTSKHSESGSRSAAVAPSSSQRIVPAAGEILIGSAGNHGGSRVKLSEVVLLLSAHVGRGKASQLVCRPTSLPCTDLRWEYLQHLWLGISRKPAPEPVAFDCASWRKSRLPLLVCIAPIGLEL